MLRPCDEPPDGSQRVSLQPFSYPAPSPSDPLPPTKKGQKMNGAQYSLLCANFCDQNSGEIVCNPTDESAVRPFHHDADEVFSAGVANEDAATAPELRLRFCKSVVVPGERFERRLRRNFPVHKELRHGSKGRELRERATRVGQQLTRNKRCVDPIARRVDR